MSADKDTFVLLVNMSLGLHADLLRYAEEHKITLDESLRRTAKAGLEKQPSAHVAA